jgi:O-antigen ligase
MTSYKWTSKIFVLLICYMPIIAVYIPSTHFGSGIPDIGPVRLLSYLLVLFFIVEATLTRRDIVFNKWVFNLLFYSMIVICSVSWSGWYSYDSTTLQRLFDSVFMPFVVAFVALNIFQTEEAIHRYVQHVSLAAFCFAIIGIVQFVVGTEGSEAEVRAAATLGNPNALAIFLVLCLPCMIYATEKRIVTGKKGWLAVICVMAGIVSTVSRKGIATMAAAFFLYYFLTRQFRKLFLLLLAFVLLVALGSGYRIISHRFARQKVEYEFVGKWSMTRAGWHMFLRSPLIGLGFEGYYQNFGLYFPYSGIRNYDAHNIFITALANYGLFGFIPFMGIFIIPLLRATRILSKRRRTQDRVVTEDMAVICTASVLPFMASGFFGGGVFYNQILVSLFYAHASLVFVHETRRDTVY